MRQTAGATERLIVALDVPDVAEARELVGKLGDVVGFYKIGLELVMAGGLQLAEELLSQGRQVFLDMKYLDIGHTVERAVAAAANLGVTCLTIHGTDAKTMKAAVAGRGDSPMRLLAVTVLTNLNETDLRQQGIVATPAELVVQRASRARTCGIDGVIASGQEAHRLREIVGPDFLIVTPGIRLAGSATGDQERVMSPDHAVASGADYIVVGRPVTQADDPRGAARTFISYIEAGLAARRAAH